MATNNSNQKYVLKIDQEQSGQRLDKALLLCPDISSRTRAVQLLDSNLVLVNNKTAKASYKVEENDIIEIHFPEAKENTLKTFDFQLDYVYEDEDIIVINKAAGMVVHPAAGHQDDSLVNALLASGKKLSMGFNEQRPGIVHRLDKDTSGLIVVAKNDKAHHGLAAQFKNKTAGREYIAFVFGRPISMRGRIESYLARHLNDRKRWASAKKAGVGKHAVTNYQVIADYHKQISKMKLVLETGRTHQIRVHLSEMGHAIVSDWTYCQKSRANVVEAKELREQILNLNRFALHAQTLSFVHPISGEAMKFEKELPLELLFLDKLFN